MRKQKNMPPMKQAEKRPEPRLSKAWPVGCRSLPAPGCLAPTPLTPDVRWPAGCRSGSHGLPRPHVAPTAARVWHCEFGACAPPA